MAVTNQNCIYEEIKSKLKLENAWCHSAKNILTSHLLCKNVNIKMYVTIILPFVFMGVQSGLSHTEMYFWILPRF
jgi:hypothetical protein